jgi:hypothetical protein
MALQMALQGMASSQCEEDNAGFGLLRRMIGSFGSFEVGEVFFWALLPRICQGPKDQRDFPKDFAALRTQEMKGQGEREHQRAGHMLC